jgi:hypothetical protein
MPNRDIIVKTDGCPKKGWSRMKSPGRGTVEIGSDTIHYLDVREHSPDALRAKLEPFIEEVTPSERTGPTGLRGLVIAAPQPSDGLALALARCGIRLIIGPVSASVATLLGQFREQMRVIGSAEPPPGTAGTRAESSPGAPPSQGRSESPYSQRPPWFNQTAFDEGSRHLQQSWHEEDSWKSET